MKVVIDPGHGQYSNRGVLGYYEGTWMWHLGQYLQSELLARGWKVTNTRPRITDDPALEWRGQQAAGHDLFISLHSNAPGSGAANYANIRGVSIYDSVSDELDYLEVPLAAEIARLMGSPNLGVKHRWNTREDRHDQDYYGVLRNAVTVAGCPDAMLIEHCYHTNEITARWLMSHDNLKRLAAAEAAIIDRLWRQKHGLSTNESEGFMEKIFQGVPKGLVATGLWQLILLVLGYPLGAFGPNGDGVDESFGPTTGNQTIQFKKDNGIAYTAATATVVDASIYKAALAALKAKQGSGSAAELKAAQEAVARLEQDMAVLRQQLADVSGIKNILEKDLQTIAAANRLLDKY